MFVRLFARFSATTQRNATRRNLHREQALSFSINRRADELSSRSLRNTPRYLHRRSAALLTAVVRRLVLAALAAAAAVVVAVVAQDADCAAFACPCVCLCVCLCLCDLSVLPAANLRLASLRRLRVAQAAASWSRVSLASQRQGDEPSASRTGNGDSSRSE